MLFQTFFDVAWKFKIMEYQQPSITMFGIQVGEPVTSLTAVMISIICLYAFIKLGRITPGNRTLQYLRYYFLVMSIATANGGIIGHAFLAHLSFSWKLIGWLLSMFSIMLIERASIEYASRLIPEKLARWLKWINIFELMLFVTITIFTLNFFFVEVHTTYGLLIVVASLHLFVYQKTKSEGSRLFLIAVGFAAVSALIFMNQLSISKWFNYNDISHIFLAFAAWYFYRGSRKIGTEDLYDINRKQMLRISIQKPVNKRNLKIMR